MSFMNMFYDLLRLSSFFNFNCCFIGFIFILNNLSILKSQGYLPACPGISSSGCVPQPPVICFLCDAGQAGNYHKKLSFFYSSYSVSLINLFTFFVKETHTQQNNVKKGSPKQSFKEVLRNIKSKFNSNDFFNLT